MKAARLATVALVLWGLTVLVVGVAFYRSHRTARGGADPRVVIALPAEGRDALLAEMRMMLGSVNEILAASGARDTAAMRVAASASGMAAAADPKLAQYLPAGFLQLGMITHMRFDSLAAAIAAGAPRDTVTAHLARITAGCTSCHVAYRLAVRQ